MTYIIIITIAFSAIITFAFYVFVDNDNVKGTMFAMQIVLLIAIIIIGLLEYNTKRVEPIDVYRGKTTLQITYQDSTPIDTIVVFKQQQ